MKLQSAYSYRAAFHSTRQAPARCPGWWYGAILSQRILTELTRFMRDGPR